MPARTRRTLWRLFVVGCAAVFVLLRLIGGPAEEPTTSLISTGKVAVVGVTGRPELTATDRRVVADHLDDLQIGSMSIRARYVGDCAAAGWTTLGAGRRAAVGGLCTPQVADGRVSDWAARQVAARASFGDARLGTLGGSTSGCVGAVGPGAALAAAKPDGSLAAYTGDVAGWLAGGAALECPITLIDAGADAEAVIGRLEAVDDLTVVVTGIGPAPGSDDPDLQVVYRIGTTLPGWLTSASTRRTGVVTLNDLTRTLIGFGGGSTATDAAVDGSPIEVVEAPLSLPAVERQLASVRALSDAVITGYLACGIGGALLGVLMGVAFWRRAYGVVLAVLTAGSVWLASMALTGAVPWQVQDRPGAFVAVLVWVWIVLLGSLAWVGGRITRTPATIVAATLTVGVFTADAALGAVMQPGSLLNSRPIFGLRWYGFGNVTFAAYATAGLLLAGWIAARFLAKGRRPTALIAVAVIGFGIVACEGWPTMGTDFGGVVALTPAVLWLLLALSGWRITWLRVAVIAALGVAAVAAVSVLDWSRGPERRSHLGNFVQRVIDGDAFDIVVRKAVASAETLVHPMGLVSLAVGIPLWIVVFRRAVPRLQGRFPTLGPVAVACLSVAVLGTVLNDGGVSVWLTVTASFAVCLAWFWVDELRTARTRGAAPHPHPAPGRLSGPASRHGGTGRSR